VMRVEEGTIQSLKDVVDNQDEETKKHIAYNILQLTYTTFRQQVFLPCYTAKSARRLLEYNRNDERPIKMDVAERVIEAFFKAWKDSFYKIMEMPEPPETEFEELSDDMIREHRLRPNLTVGQTLYSRNPKVIKDSVVTHVEQRFIKVNDGEREHRIVKLDIPEYFVFDLDG